MFIYDITINGSLVAEGKGDTPDRAYWDALKTVEGVSRNNPTRLVRLHSVDGTTVIAEYRNGRMVQR